MVQIILLALALLVSPAFAGETQSLDPVLVTASKIETKLDRVSSSYTLITSDEIERKNPQTVADLLRETTGVQVVRTGPPGGATTLFIRGLDGKNTLVILDGVIINDAMDPGRAFDWNTLDPTSIERIEIVRGPQTVAWGTNAAAAVIQIFTKRGKGPFQGQVNVEGGAYRTQKFGARANGKTESGFAYSVGASMFSVEGPSSADEALGNTEKDGERTATLSTAVSKDFTESDALELTSRYQQAAIDLDESGGAPSSSSGDDPNYTLKKTQWDSGLKFRHRFSKSATLEVLGAFSKNVHSTRDGLDNYDSSIQRTFYNSSRNTFGLQQSFGLAEFGTVLVGAQSETERGIAEETGFFGGADTTTRARVSTVGAFVQTHGDFGLVFTDLGGRVDRNDRYGSSTTYRAGMGFGEFPTGTIVKGTLGTAFLAPSLYQFANPTYGNPNLKPERSFGWDAGFEQRLLGGGDRGARLKLGSTYYENRVREKLSSDPTTFKSINLGRVNTKGIETFFTAASEFNSPVLSFAEAKLEHHYAIAKDPSTGKDLARRPRHKWSLDVGTTWFAKLEVGVTTLFVGERYDLTSSTKFTEPYTTFDFRAAYRLKDDLRLTLRCENAFDERYQEAVGYGTMGRAIYAGLAKDL